MTRKELIDYIFDEYSAEPDFRPAYHMNKDKWITILLDGSAEQGDIKALLAMSYGMTASKIRKVRSS